MKEINFEKLTKIMTRWMKMKNWLYATEQRAGI